MDCDYSSMAVACSRSVQWAGLHELGFHIGGFQGCRPRRMVGSILLSLPRLAIHTCKRTSRIPSFLSLSWPSPKANSLVCAPALPANPGHALGTLRLSLMTGRTVSHLCHPKFVVLENVMQCWQDEEVISHITQLCTTKDWSWKLLQQDLQRDWAINRTRGWLIMGCQQLVESVLPLSHPDFDLLPKHLIPELPTCPTMQASVLRLTQDERRVYTELFKQHQFLLRPAATLMHSLGNLTHTCPCGCRPTGISMARLQQKGATGLIIQDSDGLRLVHPAEAACLQGAWLPERLLEILEPSDLRLLLAAVGQMASPLHSGNIAIQLAANLNGVSPPPDIRLALTQHVTQQWRLACHKLLGLL